MEPTSQFLDENNIPQEQFSGLSITQLYVLVNKPLSADSPLKLNSTIPAYVLDNSPFFRSCEEFLSLLNVPGGIRLTNSGSLPKSHLLSLYRSSIAKHPDIPQDSNSSKKIGDWNFLDSVCQVCLIAGLLKMHETRLLLTRKGELLLGIDKRSKLFKTLLQAFGDKFNWAYNDGYTEAGVGQIGWAYTILMLMHYGDKTRPDGFYADRYYKAFPMMLEYFEDEYIPIEEEANDCYSLRAIHRFTAWWGFSNASDTDFEVPQVRSARTIYDDLFELFSLDEIKAVIPGTGTYN